MDVFTREIRSIGYKQILDGHAVKETKLERGGS